MKLKMKDTIRIGFLNINGIPNSNHDAKNSDLREAINKGQFDCIGLAEVNRNWNKIPLQHKWHNRISSWWESSKSITSFNTKDCMQEDFQHSRRDPQNHLCLGSLSSLGLQSNFYLVERSRSTKY